MKRILLVCPSPWDHEELALPAYGGAHSFVPYCSDLLPADLGSSRLLSLWKVATFRVRCLEEAVRKEFVGFRIDGVIGTGDYPSCLLASIVASALRLPGPTPEAVLRASHKVHARAIERGVLPDSAPKFFAFDPLRFDAYAASLPLEFPFFIKPAKGTMSIRAQTVRSRAEFATAVEFSFVEKLIGRIVLRPFQQMLDEFLDDAVPAHFFIGEELLGGDQVTVDGFVQHGRVKIMGVVDSVMYPGTISFERFEYPSRLPDAVQLEMAELARTLIAALGFDNGCFNIEMFYHQATGSIRVIEVNPRMSYQFADLYEKVDGTSTYAVALALATGDPVHFVRGQGRHRAAASFVMRTFRDHVALMVPSKAEVRRLAGGACDTRVKVLARAGRRLSSLPQDVGSFRYCIVNMGGESQQVLAERYREIEQRLSFSLSATGS